MCGRRWKRVRTWRGYACKHLYQDYSHQRMGILLLFDNPLWVHLPRISVHVALSALVVFTHDAMGTITLYISPRHCIPASPPTHTGQGCKPLSTRAVGSTVLATARGVRCVEGPDIVSPTLRPRIFLIRRSQRWPHGRIYRKVHNRYSDGSSSLCIVSFKISSRGG